MQPHAGGPQNVNDDPHLENALRRLADAESALRDARSALWSLRERDAVPAPQAGEANPYRAPAYPAPLPQQPAKPAKPAKARTLTGEQIMIRAIAGSGVVITVLGVGFAVAVAIQNGWLGPLWRVLLTAALAAALVAAATVLHRRDGPAAGVASLAVTSVFTSFLLVLSLVGVLSWWSPGVGAAAFVLLWAFYLYLYRVFNWRPVALTLIVLGAGLSGLYVWITPATFDVLIYLIALLPFLALGATWGESDGQTRKWALAGIAGASVLHTVFGTFDSASYYVAVAGVAAIVLVCLLDPVDSATDRVFGPGCAWVTAVAAAILTPMGLPGYLLPLALLLVQLGAGRIAKPAGGEAADTFRVHTAALLPVSLLLPLVTWLNAYPHPETLLGSPGVTRLVVLAGFCVFILAPHASRRILNAGMAGWLFAVSAATVSLLSNVLGDDPMELTHVWALIAALLSALAIACLFARRRVLAGINPVLVWPLAGVGLLLSMYAVVITVVWLAHVIGGTGAMQTGYLVGHSLVSLGWMLIAAWALLGRAPIPQSWSLWVGGILAAAAVVKLVFFDLQALTGIARAVAFLACGLVLLTIVSLRTRLQQQSQDVRPVPPAGTDP